MIKNGLKNEDLINFFKEKSSKNKEYNQKYLYFDKKPINNLEPFQCFYLSDLISLLNHKKILKIDPKINEFRNFIMHNKNIVEHKNYGEANLIYDFESFEKIFHLVKLFNTKILKIK